MSDKVPNAVQCQDATAVSAKEKAEMKIAVRYAKDSEQHALKLIQKVQDMWRISSRWYSKVPEDDERFYYFFTLKPTDREAAVEEIEKYVEFHKEVSTALGKIKGDVKMTEAEKANPQNIIATVREKLENMLNEAKSGKRVTANSITYRLHKEFIANYEKLESMIKNVQIVSQKQGLNCASQRWKRCQEDMGSLRKEIQELKECYTHQIEKVDLANDKHEKKRHEQDKKIEEQNKRISELQRDFEAQQARVETLISQNAKLSEQCEKLLSDKQKLEEAISIGP